MGGCSVTTLRAAVFTEAASRCGSGRPVSSYINVAQCAPPRASGDGRPKKPAGSRQRSQVQRAVGGTRGSMSAHPPAEMDGPPELTELPSKKAKLDMDDRLEKATRNLAEDGSPQNTYPALTAVRDQGQPDQQSALAPQACSDPMNSYAHSVGPCKDPDTTVVSEYSQMYQDNNPAVTSYGNQVAFSPMAQSSVYSFPQAGQTYGLPPFGAIGQA
ncbi:unnamed protein product [Arctogadus glacialis]